MSPKPECVEWLLDSSPDGAETAGHSHTSAVAELARRAEVGRLVLVHLDPAMNEPDPIGLPDAQAIFPNTQLGEDRLELGF